MEDKILYLHINFNFSHMHCTWYSFSKACY